jgi:prevent-host-death family protein
METVTIHNAKTNLSRILAEVEAGKEVTIARGKKPIAKIVPIDAKPKRVAGKYKGQFKVPPEFFKPMSDEELALWYDGKVF